MNKKIIADKKKRWRLTEHKSKKTKKRLRSGALNDQLEDRR